MRGMIRVWLLILFCSACQVASAQSYCTGSIPSSPLTCSNSGCSETITISTIGGEEYGAQASCGVISCCGIGGFPSCSYTGGSCLSDAKLNDPMIRRHLVELARTQDVMVASCDGNYRPLMAVLKERPDVNFAVRKLPSINGGGR